jgi:L-amino acid N-acyltransferase YncA
VTLLTMAEITVRVLGESEWSLYREVRLRALAQSPSAFTATLADEANRGESFWRERMTRSYRLLAERGQLLQGIVSLGAYDEEPSAAEVVGLCVVPDARGTGVSWRLVEAAAALATQNGYLQLYFWVGTDNGRAIGFAKNFGFRFSGYRVHHAPLTLSWARRRSRWCCHWSSTPHQCRTGQVGRQQPAKAPSAENPEAPSPGDRRAGAFSQRRLC